MSSSLLGAALVMAIFSAGALVIYFVLRSTGGAGLNNEGAAKLLLKNFRYFVIFELVLGAVVGWVIGPILFSSMGAG